MGELEFVGSTLEGEGNSVALEATLGIKDGVVLSRLIGAFDCVVPSIESWLFDGEVIGIAGKIVGVLSGIALGMLAPEAIC
jgi:hypothetical protein